MGNLHLSPSRLPKYRSSYHRSFSFLPAKCLTAWYYVSTEISYVSYKEEWIFREHERRGEEQKHGERGKQKHMPIYYIGGGFQSVNVTDKRFFKKISFDCARQSSLIQLFILSSVQLFTQLFIRRLLYSVLKH
jgi:hypothetical protein